MSGHQEYTCPKCGLEYESLEKPNCPNCRENACNNQPRITASIRSDTRTLDSIEMSIRCWNVLHKEWLKTDRAPYSKKLVTLGDLRQVPSHYFAAHVRCCGLKTIMEIAKICAQ